MRKILFIVAALPLSACAFDDYDGPRYLSYDSCPVGYYRSGNMCRSYAGDDRRNNIYSYGGNYYGSYRPSTRPAYPNQRYGGSSQNNRSYSSNNGSDYYGRNQPRLRDREVSVSHRREFAPNGDPFNFRREHVRQSREDRGGHNRSSGGRHGRH